MESRAVKSKRNWIWWLADIICLLVVVLYFLREGTRSESPGAKPEARAHSPELGRRIAEQTIGKGGDSASSVGAVISDGGEMGSVYGPKGRTSRVGGKTEVMDASISKAGRAEPVYGRRVADRPPSELMELTKCLEDHEFRKAVYTAAEVYSGGPELARRAYGLMGLGITLYSTNAFAECIPVIEEALALNEKAERNRNVVYLGNLLLANAYHQIGCDAKAFQHLSEARASAQNRNEVEQAEMVEKLISATAE